MTTKRKDYFERKQDIGAIGGTNLPDTALESENQCIGIEAL